MLSMTGFGRGTAQVGQTTATVEMRSVNSRYCEVSVRLPRSLAERDTEVQNLVRQALERGRITVQVQIEQAAAAQVPLRLDVEAARAYARLLEELRQAAGIEEPIRLEHLLAYPDVFVSAETPDEAQAEAWQAVQAALEQAIAGIRTMRRQEGDALQADLESRIDAIERTLGEVEQRAPQRVAEARDRLHKRLEELFADERIDRDRLELEIAILADRLDVTEECVRLRSHLQLFREALRSDTSEGRKLNFIAQEINREVNTIGSKANDAAVARLVVQMKDELEKIREQVQNVE